MRTFCLCLSLANVFLRDIGQLRGGVFTSALFLFKIYIFCVFSVYLIYIK